jgi:hypothetical protein
MYRLLHVFAVALVRSCGIGFQEIFGEDGSIHECLVGRGRRREQPIDSRSSEKLGNVRKRR